MKWDPLIRGWFKLNTDGSAKGNPDWADAGSLIRDHEGQWVKGFYTSLGHMSNIVAELWGLLESLNMAINLQITHLMIELDAKVVCDMISKDHCANNFLMHLILECRNLIKKIPHSTLNHVYKEANACADFLANRGQQLQAPLSFFCSPLVDVYLLLRNDLSFAMHPCSVVRGSVT